MEERVWHKHWPKGLPWTLDYPEVSVDILLRTSATLYPDRVAVDFKEKATTYAQLWDRARSFAAFLSDMGIGRGDVVCIHMTNCPQFMVAYYGIMLAGATYSPANPLYSPQELEHQLADCGAKAIVTLEQFVPVLMQVMGNTQIKHVIVTNETEAVSHAPMDASVLIKGASSFQEVLDTYPPAPPRISINARKDLAHLAYTGGTTGVSKGVMLTHLNVVTNVVQYHAWLTSGKPVVKDGILIFKTKYEVPEGGHWEFLSDEGNMTMIAISPWYHAMGTIGSLGAYVLKGYTQVLMDRFDPLAYLNLVEKHKVTQISGAPALYLALVSTPGIEDRDFSYVRRLGGGGAPFSRALLDRITTTFPNALFSEGLGMTEVTTFACFQPSNWSGLRKLGTVGIPLFDTDIKIVDLETGNRELPMGEDGEICFKGPQVMQGYLNQPEETAAALRDGWMYSGDIGHLDEDGYLTIVDRKKDMIIYKGYNVYPRDLEEILAKHPAVLLCAVIGVPDPDVGEWPKAFVVKKAGQKITTDALMDYVNSQVTPYKKIRELDYLPELPVTGVGKVRKKTLRDQEIQRQKDTDSIDGTC